MHSDDKEEHWTIMLHKRCHMAPNMAANTSIKLTIHSDLVILVVLSYYQEKDQVGNRLNYMATKMVNKTFK